MDALENMLSDTFSDDQRAQVFLRLADGGLGFGSAEAAVATAYLGSWALTLKDVARCLGETSWGGFQTRCGAVAASISRAEAHLHQLAGGSLGGVNWVDCLAEPKPKLQGVWSAKLRDWGRKELLRTLGEDDRVDFRSAGGPGAGGFLEPPVQLEGEKPAEMPDAHFTIMLQDRLRCNVCPEGARCQHRSKTGVLCNQPLDRRGKHVHKCEVGPTRTGRHDSIRDWTAKFHQKTTGLTAVTEQRVPAWDRVNPRTGRLEEARLDVATRDAVTGRKIYVDTTVTCAHSDYQPRQRARANKDGLAASNAVDEKRERYPPSGGELVPMAFETGGRPAEETRTFVRTWGQGLGPAERTEVIRYAWQQLSKLVQIGNAEMLLSAIG